MAATASAAAISTFDTDAENWSVVSFTNPNAGDFSVLSTTAPTYNATGGNPGGFISTVDPDNGDFMFGAPGKFLGNQIGRRLALLRLDLSGRQPRLQAGRHHAHRAAPRDSSGSATQPSRSAPASPTSPSASRPRANWHLGTTGGATPTAADFQTVLANLTGLFISGEYTVGLIETPGLDNVKLSVPEPTSLALVAIATITALALRWRRRTE